MPVSAEKAKKGKAFESNLIPKLKAQTEKLGIQFIRLYDSYSGFSNGSSVFVRIPGQLSDFIFVFNESKCCFVEFKYTETEYFYLDMLSETQRIGFENSIKNNFHYFILIYCEINSLYYLLDTKKILEVNPKKTASKTFNLKEFFSDNSYTDYKDLFKVLNLKYQLCGNPEVKHNDYSTKN